MNIEDRIRDVTSQTDECESMFVYGSHARTPNRSNDCEIAVLINCEDVGSEVLNRFETEFNNQDLKFFPFSKERFIKYELKTTFTTPIFYREIMKDGYTVYGSPTLERIDAPNIRINDLKRDIGFQIGQVFSALKSHRSGNLDVSTELTYKSGILGARLKYLIDEDELLTGYETITQKMNESILQRLLELRKLNRTVDEEMVHETLSYLRNDVESYIESAEPDTY